MIVLHLHIGVSRPLICVVMLAVSIVSAISPHRHRDVLSAANRRMKNPLFVRTLQGHRRTLSLGAASSIGHVAGARRQGNRFHPFYQRNDIPRNRPPWMQSNEANAPGNIAVNRFYSQLFMAAVDEEEDTDWRSSAETMDRRWKIGGLKKEVQRHIFRCHKKVGKASERLQSAKTTVERLANQNDSSSVTMEDLENCPDAEALAMELDELKSRLRNLNRLEKSLQGIKNSAAAVALPDQVAELALDLGVNDEPPQRKERGPPKQKGPRTSSERLPYRRYYSFNNVEIRVGKRAEDNDALTLSPKHRDGSDWWIHASSCAGSHVVIRCSDEKLAEDVVMDAAALAARQSKNKRSKIVKVSLTRCRDISKPPGAKAGLVRLTGDVRTITVDMNKAETRLQRLDETELIN
jgi:NFACT protein RNA binding domain